MQRRGLCWACYRKLREANAPLPLRVCDRPSDPIDAWVTLLPLDVIARMQRALQARRKQLKEAVRMARMIARTKTKAVPLDAPSSAAA